MTVSSSRTKKLIFPSGMKKRWWFFRPLDLLISFYPLKKKKRGLLIVRMDGLGDMVLFRQALERYPNAFRVNKRDITILGCNSWKSIAADVFKGYNVKTIDEKSFEKNPLYRFIISLWVRRQGFQTAVCDTFFRKTLTADSLMLASGADKMIVSKPYISKKNKSEFSYYLPKYDQVIPTGKHPLHEVIRHYNFLSKLSSKRISPDRPTINWRKKSPPVPKGKPFIVMNFGSNEPGRNWPLENFLDIARKIAKLGYRVVFVGSKHERKDKNVIGTTLNGSAFVDLIDKTSLPQLFDTIKHAKALITNETGPGHMGIALGVPTLMIYGGGHDTTFVPYPRELKVRNALFVNYYMDCYQCLWSCPYRESKLEPFPCIEKVNTQKVWSSLKRFL
jgi:ADP-heptose:LPS heptosyltransferase